MKKSTILVLVIVYLSSIFIVGVYGLQSKNNNEITYCEGITPTKIILSTGKVFTGDDIIADENVPNLYKVTISSKDYSDGFTVIVEYDLSPADCTFKDVVITPISTSEIPSATVIDGKIVFSRKGAIDINYKAQDKASGAAEMTIRIRFGR